MYDLTHLEAFYGKTVLPTDFSIWIQEAPIRIILFVAASLSRNSEVHRPAGRCGLLVLAGLPRPRSCHSPQQQASMGTKDVI